MAKGKEFELSTRGMLIMVTIICVVGFGAMVGNWYLTPEFERDAGPFFFGYHPLQPLEGDTCFIACDDNGVRFAWSDQATGERHEGVIPRKRCRVVNDDISPPRCTFTYRRSVRFGGTFQPGTWTSFVKNVTIYGTASALAPLQPRDG